MPTLDFQITASVAAVEIGVLVSSFLFGLLTLQVYYYFSLSFGDSKFLRWLAGLMWILELGHLICVAHLIYTATISSQPERLSAMFVNPPPNINTAILLSGSTSCLVQSYFAGRVHRLTGILWLPILLWFLILLTMVGTVGACIVTYAGGLEDFTRHWSWVSLASWITSAFIDFVNAGVMSWRLIKYRQSTLKITHRLIDKINLMTISTGSLTCIVDVATAVCFLKMPYTLVYIGLYICIARMYAISFFAFLNARTSLREEVVMDESLHFATINPNIRSDSPSSKPPVTFIPLTWWIDRVLYHSGVPRSTHLCTRIPDTIGIAL